MKATSRWPCAIPSDLRDPRRARLRHRPQGLRGRGAGGPDLPGSREALRQASSAPLRDLGGEAFAFAEGRGGAESLRPASSPGVLRGRERPQPRRSARPPSAPKSPTAPTPGGLETAVLAAAASPSRSGPGESEGIAWEDTTGSPISPETGEFSPPPAPFEEAEAFEFAAFEPARAEPLRGSFPPPPEEDFDQVLAATDRDAIAGAVLAALVRRFPSAAIFSSRSEGVTGWDAAGKDVDPSALRSFSVSWDRALGFLDRAHLPRFLRWVRCRRFPDTTSWRPLWAVGRAKVSSSRSSSGKSPSHSSTPPLPLRAPFPRGTSPSSAGFAMRPRRPLRTLSD